MTRIVLAFALLAILAGAVDPTPSTVSLTTGSFAAAPGSKVIDATTTTAADYATWYLYDSVKFGPATTNGTIYAYGFDFGTNALTKVITRALNATLLSNGTAATAVTDAKIGSDGAWAPATTTISEPVSGVGLGSVAIAYVAIDSAAVPCHQLWLAVLNGGSSSPVFTKQLTSNTCTKCTAATASTGNGYTYTLGNVYYDNATYFVSYTQAAFIQTETNPTSTTCGTTAPIATGTGITVTYKGYVQGVAATGTGALSYTTIPELYSSTTAAPTATPQCGPSNWTNSTNIYCVHKDAATNPSLVLTPVLMADGTKGTAVTLATDSSTGTGATLLTQAFTLAGFVYSEHQQGVLINNKTTAGATPTYSNNLNFYNTTSGAATQTAGGTIVGSTYTNAIQTSAYVGAGINYVDGYAIINQYVSSSSGTTTTTYEWGSFLSNSTVNTTKVTIGTTQGGGNFFIDVNGAVWFGGYTYDTTAGSGVTSASVGKLIAQIYSAGNILASFFALLSIMIAAVFAF